MRSNDILTSTPRVPTSSGETSGLARLLKVPDQVNSHTKIADMMRRKISRACTTRTVEAPEANGNEETSVRSPSLELDAGLSIFLNLADGEKRHGRMTDTADQGR